MGTTSGPWEGAGILPKEDGVMYAKTVLAIAAACSGMAMILTGILCRAHWEALTRSAIRSYSPLETRWRVSKSFLSR